MKYTIAEIRDWRKAQSALKKPSGLNDFYRAHNVLCPSCGKSFAAQHRLYLTAFGVGGLAFLAGFLVCWSAFVR